MHTLSTVSQHLSPPSVLSPRAAAGGFGPQQSPAFIQYFMGGGGGGGRTATAVGLFAVADTISTCLVSASSPPLRKQDYCFYDSYLKDEETEVQRVGSKRASKCHSSLAPPTAVSHP